MLLGLEPARTGAKNRRAASQCEKLNFRLTRHREVGESLVCETQSSPGIAGHEARPHGGLLCVYWVVVVSSFIRRDRSRRETP